MDKSGLIKFAVCFLAGVVGFFIVVPTMLDAGIISFNWGLFAVPTLMMAIGALGFFGLLIIGLYNWVRKWIADGVSY